MTNQRVWQVRLPDGSVWVPDDAIPGNARASWIYARSTADMFARDLGGAVVELTARQRDKVLDQEIATALAETKPAIKPPKKIKTRARPFSRDVQRKIAAAILEEIPLNHAARAAVDTAQETDDDAEHAKALRMLKAGLPETLWVGYDTDAKHRHAMVQTAMPMWTDEDPEGGENPAHWMQIDREEAARILTESG
jgi:hypothetical protein